MSIGILSLLPLLIIMLMVVALVVINKRFTRKPFTFHKVKWLFFGYFSFLLLASIFSFVLPKSDAKILDVNDLNQHWHNGIFQKALEGEFSSIAEKNIEGRWEFHIGDTLELQSYHYDEGILIERTSELEDKIEVLFIKDWDVLGINSVNLDISEYTPEMEVEMNSNTLRFVSSEVGHKVEIAFHDLPFTMKQLGGNGHYGSVGYSASRSRFFYIRVPEELEVQVPEFMYVDYVN